jgi:hypothetical protein
MIGRIDICYLDLQAENNTNIGGAKVKNGRLLPLGSDAMSWLSHMRNDCSISIHIF